MIFIFPYQRVIHIIYAATTATTPYLVVFVTFHHAGRGSRGIAMRVLMLLLLLLQLTLILVLELLLLKTDLVKQRHFVVARGPTCQSAAAAPPAATRGEKETKGV